MWNQTLTGTKKFSILFEVKKFDWISGGTVVVIFSISYSTAESTSFLDKPHGKR